MYDSYLNFVFYKYRMFFLMGDINFGLLVVFFIQIKILLLFKKIVFDVLY